MADTSVVFDVLAKDGASAVMSRVRGATLGLFSAFAIGAGVRFGNQAIQDASDLNEVVSKTNVLFGAASGGLITWADTAERTLGQSKTQALDAAATFAVFGKSAGLTGTNLSDFSTRLVTLATDMASFSNTSPQEAIDAIGAGLRGESEPLQRYGVLLNDATLKQRALSLGLIKTTTQALTPQQRVLAAQAEILAQTSTQQGDFARTSGGAANQQRILTAELANARTELGTKLLPAFLGATKAAVGLLGFVKDNSGWLLPLGTGLAAAAAAVWGINSAMSAYKATQTAFTAVSRVWNLVTKEGVIQQWLLNTAMYANPIGLVVAAVALLVGGFVILWVKCAAFREFWIMVWDGIKTAALAVANWFAGPFVGFFKGAWEWIQNAAGAAYTWITDKWNAFIGFFSSLPARITAIASTMWNGLINTYRSAINFLIRGWNALDFGIHIGIPSWVPLIGGKRLDIDDVIPDIPYLAKGGLVKVGEKGPEIVSLPNGAAVYPNGSVPAGAAPVSGTLVAGRTGDALADALIAILAPRIRFGYGGNVTAALGGR